MKAAFLALSLAASLVLGALAWNKRGAGFVPMPTPGADVLSPAGRPPRVPIGDAASPGPTALPPDMATRLLAITPAQSAEQLSLELQALGAPDLVRYWAVRAFVQDQYREEKLAAHLAFETDSWRALAPRQDRLVKERLGSLAKAENELIETLVGGYPRTPEMVAIDQRIRAYRFGAIPEEKVSLLEGRPPAKPAELLNEMELREHELRNSPVARKVMAAGRSLSLTEQEYIGLVEAERTLRPGISPGTVAGQNDSYRQTVHEILGEERGAGYLKGIK